MFFTSSTFSKINIGLIKKINTSGSLVYLCTLGYTFTQGGGETQQVKRDNRSAN